MRKNAGLILLLVVLTACAPSKVWESSPLSQAAENKYYSVQLQPLKNENNFFTSFRLVVTNKTNKRLEIDWIKTRYIYNGHLNGRFMFEGMDTKNINNPPPDIISAGNILTKVIWPIKLLAYAPYRDQRVPVGERGFSRGLMQEGENGMDLVIRQNGQEVREIITLNIAATKEF